MNGQEPSQGRSLGTREEFQAFAAKLLAAAQFLQIYPRRHPHVEQGLKELFEQLSSQLELRGKIQLAVAPTEFLFGSIQIPIDGELFGEMAKLLQAAGVQKLEFTAGLEEWETRKFLSLLLLSPDQLWAMGGLTEVIASENITHIIVSTIKLGAGGTTDPESLFRTWEAYSTGLRLVQSIRGRVRSDGTVADIEQAKKFARELVELAVSETRPLLAVQALKTHDDYSYTHSVNVAMLTVAIATSLEFPPDHLHEIGVAALLHDVGKELIPLEILHKPGKLDEEEWVIVNRHGRDGARMLAATEGLGDLAPVVSYEHHLAYHDELSSDPDWKPHIASEIVCIADVYDALRSERPYREGLAPDKSMRIMEEDVGRLFDPDLFEGFLRMMGYYPPGTSVRLQDGTIAIVHTVNSDHPSQPHMLSVKSPSGLLIEPPEHVDLSQSGPEKQVASIADPDEVGVEPMDVL
jgi:hypothetical protein